MKTYLYCFKMANGMVKVGISSEIFKRIKTLQNIYSQILNKESFVIEFDDYDNAYEAEQAIHNLLINQRLQKIATNWTFSNEGSTEIYPTSSYENIKNLFTVYASLYGKNITSGLSKVLVKEIGNVKHGKALLHRFLNDNQVFKPVKAKRNTSEKERIDLSCNSYDFKVYTYQLDAIQDQMFLNYFLSFKKPDLKLDFKTAMNELGYKDVAGFKKTLMSKLEKLSQVVFVAKDKKFNKQIRFRLLDYTLNFTRHCQTHVMAVGQIHITFNSYVKEIFNHKLTLRNYKDFQGLTKPVSGLLLNNLPKRNHIENRAICLNDFKGITTLSKIEASLKELKQKQLIANWKIENNHVNIGMV